MQYISVVVQEVVICGVEGLVKESSISRLGSVEKELFIIWFRGANLR